ncbi:L-lactate permease [Lactobacillus xylocopicola]|uniref:L-lactate permease n=1 Tax=Lactobacillus xylocopicola TaxID=2976676 RepID=A0ABM8BIG9_9LACO|nr:L-lactate permease [Lactobacillus xylocopicola]BDR61108.1 L-lactate permease [Lactobacillus xylocopicola]
MDLFKTVIAIIPIVWLILSLGVFHVRGDLACVIGFVGAIVLSIVGFGFSIPDSLTAGLDGIMMAFWPIIYVIISAVFIYNISRKSGGMDTIMSMLTSITKDMRILVLILAWALGGFLEAVAGFGTAVAIPASILIMLGMEPIKAAVICLIANTAPTAFGAIGLPITTLAKVTGLGATELGFFVSIQLFILIIIIPFVLVYLTGGKGMKSFKGNGVLAATLLAGLTFAVPQIFITKYMGPELPSIVGSIVCLAALVLVTKMYNKKDSDGSNDASDKSTSDKVKAWFPFILLFVLIIATSSLFPAVKNALAGVKTSFHFYTGAHPKMVDIDWLTSPGTLILLSSLIGGAVQGLSLGKMLSVLGSTIKQLSKTIVTVCAIVGLSKVMGYSGMIATIAVSLVAITGPFYPVISPIIGVLGIFITGSDTSANVLFGGLQAQAAHALSVSPYWLAAANMAGATAGKMISPQSIAIATGATGLDGKEGVLLKKALPYCAMYTVALCAIVYIVGKLMSLL